MVDNNQKQNFFEALIEDGYTFGGNKDRASFDAAMADPQRARKLHEKLMSSGDYDLDDFDTWYADYGSGASNAPGMNGKAGGAEGDGSPAVGTGTPAVGVQNEGADRKTDEAMQNYGRWAEAANGNGGNIMAGNGRYLGSPNGEGGMEYATGYTAASVNEKNTRTAPAYSPGNGGHSAQDEERVGGQWKAGDEVRAGGATAGGGASNAPGMNGMAGGQNAGVQNIDGQNADGQNAGGLLDGDPYGTQEWLSEKGIDTEEVKPFGESEEDKRFLAMRDASAVYMGGMDEEEFKAKHGFDYSDEFYAESMQYLRSPEGRQRQKEYMRRFADVSLSAKDGLTVTAAASDKEAKKKAFDTKIARENAAADDLYNERGKTAIEAANKELSDRADMLTMVNPDYQSPKVALTLDEQADLVVNSITDADFEKYLTHAGIDYAALDDEGRKNVVVDLSRKLANKVYEEYRRKHQVTSDMGYYLEKIFDESLTGKFLQAFDPNQTSTERNIRAAGAERYAADTEMSWGERFVGEALPILADYGAMKILGTGGRMIGDKAEAAANKYIPRLINLTKGRSGAVTERWALNNTWLGRSSRFASRHLAEGTWGMGNYNLANALVSGGNEFEVLNNETGAYEFSPWKAMKTVAGAYVSGLAFSAVTTPGSMMSASARTAGQAVTSFVVGTASGGSYMTYENLLAKMHEYNVQHGYEDEDGNVLKDGGMRLWDMSWQDYAEAAGKGFTTDLVFKFQHLVTSPKGFFGQFSGQMQTMLREREKQLGLQDWSKGMVPLDNSRDGINQRISYSEKLNQLGYGGALSHYMETGERIKADNMSDREVAEQMRDEYARIMDDPRVPSEMKRSLAYTFCGDILPTGYFVGKDGHMNAAMEVEQCAFNAVIKKKKGKATVVEMSGMNGEILGTREFKTEGEAKRYYDSLAQRMEDNNRYATEWSLGKATEQELESLRDGGFDVATFEEQKRQRLIEEARMATGVDGAALDAALGKKVEQRSAEEQALVDAYMNELMHAGQTQRQRIIDDSTDGNGNVTYGVDANRNIVYIVSRPDGGNTILTVDAATGEKKQQTADKVEVIATENSEEHAAKVEEEENKTPEQVAAEEQQAEADAVAAQNEAGKAAIEQMKADQETEARRRHDEATGFLREGDALVPIERIENVADGLVAVDYDGVEHPITDPNAFVDGDAYREQERAAAEAERAAAEEQRRIDAEKAAVEEQQRIAEETAQRIETEKKAVNDAIENASSMEDLEKAQAMLNETSEDNAYTLQESEKVQAKLDARREELRMGDLNNVGSMDEMRRWEEKWLRLGDKTMSEETRKSYEEKKAALKQAEDEAKAKAEYKPQMTDEDWSEWFWMDEDGTGWSSDVWNRELEKLKGMSEEEFTRKHFGQDDVVDAKVEKENAVRVMEKIIGDVKEREAEEKRQAEIKAEEERRKAEAQAVKDQELLNQEYTEEQLAEAMKLEDYAEALKDPNHPMHGAAMKHEQTRIALNKKVAPASNKLNEAVKSGDEAAIEEAKRGLGEAVKDSPTYLLDSSANIMKGRIKSLKGNIKDTLAGKIGWRKEANGSWTMTTKDWVKKNPMSEEQLEEAVAMQKEKVDHCEAIMDVLKEEQKRRKKGRKLSAKEIAAEIEAEDEAVAEGAAGLEFEPAGEPQDTTRGGMKAQSETERTGTVDGEAERTGTGDGEAEGARAAVGENGTAVEPQDTNNTNREYGVVRDANTEDIDSVTLREMDELAKRIGAVVRIVDSVDDGNANASYEKGVILIEKGNKNPIKALMGHEALHHVKTKGEGAYRDFVEAIHNAVGDAQWQAAVDKIKRLYNGKISDADAIEEVAADLAGDLLRTDGMAEKLMQEADVSVLGTIKSWIDDVKSWWSDDFIADKYAGGAIGGASRFVLSERGLNNISKRLQEAYQDAARAQKMANAEMEVAGGKTEVNAEGDLVISEKADEGQARLSKKTYAEGGRSRLQDFLDKQVKEDKLEEREAREILETLDRAFEELDAMSGRYESFDEWNEVPIVMDENGQPVFSVIKSNGDYFMNMDFSLVCKKRRTLDAVFRGLIDAGVMNDVSLGQEDIAEINDVIRKYGFETACRLCFVDARRFRQAEVADKFVNLWNDAVKLFAPKDAVIDRFNFANDPNVVSPEGTKLHEMDVDTAGVEKAMKRYGENTVMHKVMKHLLEHPEDRRLLARADFMDAESFDEGKIQNEAIRKLYNAKKGSGGPKASSLDTPYNNEVEDSNWNRERAYAVGGVRVQSFSDYVPKLVFDYMQMFAGLASKRLPLQSYTKEELYVKQFGLTGAKINMSLVPATLKDAEGKVVPGVPAGLDADGNYLWETGETFDYDEAVRIQNDPAYGRNCGTIAVGVSDAHILKMLADPNIRMVIPYHRSGLNKKVAIHNGINTFTDYTNNQTTRYKEGGRWKSIHYTSDPTREQKVLAAEEPEFNTLVRKYGEQGYGAEAVQMAVKEYVDWCNGGNSLGLQLDPKFSQFLYEKDGSIRHGYYKMLEDFALIRPDGKGGEEYCPQGDVTMTYPKDGAAFGSMRELMERGLNEDNVLEGKRSENVDAIVKEVLDKKAKRKAKKSKKSGEDEEKEQIKSALDMNGKTGPETDGGVPMKNAGGVMTKTAGGVPLERKDGESMRDFAQRVVNEDVNAKVGTKRAKNETLVEYAKRMEKIGDSPVMSAVKDGARDEESVTKYSLKIDPETKEWLEGLKVDEENEENSDVVVVYRAMRLGEDGNLYPPMSDAGLGSSSSKSKAIKTETPKLGMWEQAEEHPEIINANGKVWILTDDGQQTEVAYDPYMHTSRTMLNDQFAAAWRRPNLVTVKCYVPKSEAQPIRDKAKGKGNWDGGWLADEAERKKHSDGYWADQAYLPTGEVEWLSGPVGRKLTEGNRRRVILSRWCKPVEIVDIDEYARGVKEQINKSGINEIPFNCVNASQRDALVRAGVKITAPTGNGDNAKSRAAYEEWLNGGGGTPGGDGRGDKLSKKRDNNLKNAWDNVVRGMKKYASAEKAYTYYSDDRRPINVSQKKKSAEEELRNLSKIYADLENEYIKNNGIEEVIEYQKEDAWNYGHYIDSHQNMEEYSSFHEKAFFDVNNYKAIHGHFPNGGVGFGSENTIFYKCDNDGNISIDYAFNIERNKNIYDYAELHSGAIADYSSKTVEKYIEESRSGLEDNPSNLGGLNSSTNGIVDQYSRGEKFGRFANQGISVGNGERDSLKNGLTDDLLNETNSDNIKLSIKAVKDKEGKTLYGSHNISEENLRKAMKLGGLANPSTAVADVNKQLHESFGEISLIMPSKMVDKRTGDNGGTWTDDTWTQTYPTTRTTLTFDGSKKFRNMLDEYGVDESLRNAFDNEITQMQFGSEPNLAWLYFKEKGKDVTEYKHPDISSDWLDVLTQYKNADQLKNAIEKDEALKQKVDRAMYSYYKIKLQQEHPDMHMAIQYGDKNNVKEALAHNREALKYVYGVDGTNFSYEQIKEAFDKYRKRYNNKKNGVDVSSTMNNAWRKAYDKDNGSDYRRWLSEKLQSLGSTEEIRDGNDRNGNAKWIANTLRNASNVMNKGKKTGANNFGGWGTFIAEFSKNMGTISEIRDNKNKITGDSEIREDVVNSFRELAQMLYEKNDDLGLFDGTAAKTLAKIVKSNNVESSCERYGVKLSDSELSVLKDFAKKMKSGIANYFETKFERPVSLSEFASAVVPMKTSEDVIKGLESAGLKIYKYNPNKEGDRSRVTMNAVNGREDIRFSKKQEEEVKSENFKRWFGDWEKDPEHASKVVDENGRPLIQKHATWEGNKGFTVFDTQSDEKANNNIGSHFGISAAEDIVENDKLGGSSKDDVYEVYLDIKKPYETYDWFAQDDSYPLMEAMRLADEAGTPEARGIVDEICKAELEAGNEWIEEMYDAYKTGGFEAAERVVDAEWFEGDTNALYTGIRKLLKMNGYDGIKYYNDLEGDGDCWVALEPEQIKSAHTDGMFENNGEFSRENKDIRYSRKTGRPMDPNDTPRSEAQTRIQEMQETIDRMMNEQGWYTDPNSLKYKTDNNMAGDVKKLVSGLEGFIKERLASHMNSAMGSLQIKALLSQVKKATRSQDLRDPVRQIQRLLNQAQMKVDAHEMEKLLNTELQKVNKKGIVEGRKVDNGIRKVMEAVKETWGELMDSDPATAKSSAAMKGDIDAEETQLEQAIDDALNNGLTPKEDDVDALYFGVPVRRQAVDIKADMEDMEAMKQDWKRAAQALTDYHKTPEYRRAKGKQSAGAQLDPDDMDVLREESRLRDVMWANEDAYLQKQREVANGTYRMNQSLKWLLAEGKERRKAMADEEMQRKADLLRAAFEDFGGADVRLEGEKKPSKVMEKVKETIDNIFSPLQSLQFLLKNDRNHMSGQGRLYDHFLLDPETSITAAEHTEHEGMRAFGEDLNKAVERIFGRNFKWNAATMGDTLYEKLRHESEQELGVVIRRPMTENEATERNARERRSGGAGTWQAGDSAEIGHMTKGHGLYLWMTWQQADGKMKLMKMGYDQDAIDQIESALGPEYIAFGKWAADDLLPRLRRERYNPTYEKLYGTSMAETPHYFPLKIDKDKLKPQTGVEDQAMATMAASASAPNIIHRRRNTSSIDETANALDVLKQYGENMEHWNAFAEVIKDANTLYGSVKLKEALEAYHQGAYKMLMEAMQVATGSYRSEEKTADKLMNGLVATWGRARINFRFYTALKQLASYPAFATYAGDGRYQADLVKNFVMGRQCMEWAYENLPMYQRRADDGSMGMEGMNDEVPLDTMQRKIGKAGMAANKAMDRYAVAAGAKAVYDYNMRKLLRNGMSRDEAHARAVIEAEITFNESQQSNVNAFSAKVQKDKTSLARALMMFRNASIGYGRKGVTGAMDMWKAYKGEAKNADGSEMTKEQRKRAFVGGLANAVNFYAVLPALWALVSGNTHKLYDLVTWDDEDDDDAFAKAALLGTLTDYTVAGSPISNVAAGYEYNPFGVVSDINSVIKERKNKKEDVASPMLIADILMKMMETGSVTGASWESVKSIADGVVGMVADVAEAGEEGRSLPIDLLIDVQIMLNMPKIDRKAWAQRLYAKYGPVAYAIATEKAQQKEINSRRIAEVAKGYVKDIDTDLARAMEDKDVKERYKDDEDYAELKADYDAVLAEVKERMKSRENGDHSEVDKDIRDLAKRWRQMSKR